MEQKAEDDVLPNADSNQVLIAFERAKVLTRDLTLS